MLIKFLFKKSNYLLFILLFLPLKSKAADFIAFFDRTQVFVSCFASVWFNASNHTVQIINVYESFSKDDEEAVKKIHPEAIAKGTHCFMDDYTDDRIRAYEYRFDLYPEQISQIHIAHILNDEDYIHPEIMKKCGL